VRAIHRLRVPAATPAGGLSVRINLLEAGTAAIHGSPAMLTTLAVTVPERSFERPPMVQAVDAAISPAVTLLGYDLAPGGAGLTLYWRAEALMDRSYAAFVHVLGPDGGLVAQADRVPGGGARPTTGWLPGEVIADVYDLPVAGAAALRVGLYDPATGERLGTVDLPIAGE
jgi:hypothetical protein